MHRGAGMRTALFICVIFEVVYIIFGSTLCLATQRSETKSKYGSVSRIQYRKSLDGESSMSIGGFKLLPRSFFVVMLVEFFTPKGFDHFADFSEFSFEANLGRPLVPTKTWGEVFGWVLRAQMFEDTDMLWSVGLQWNIHKTPGLSDVDSTKQFKSFIQFFAQTEIKSEEVKTAFWNARLGNDKYAATHFDIFHWYQFPLFSSSLAIRGTNAIYFFRNRKELYRFTQELIIPTPIERLDAIVGHFYQNEARFSRTKGSQFTLGFRYSF